MLAKVRAAGASGRAQIARASGLSTQAVSNIIGDLVADGWLCERGRRCEGRGQPAMQYAIAPFAGAALGIEVRPATVLVSLVGLDGTTLYTHRQPIPRADPETLANFVPSLLDAAMEAGKDQGADRLLGAGVVMPGPFGETGLAGAPSDLPGWAHSDPAEYFERWLSLPVRIENDANAATMNERILGSAQGIDTFAYLYFGTGLGLGIVMGGTLQRGAFGNAGEIGHIGVPYKGRIAPLESAVSRMALETAMRKASLRATRIEELEALFEARDSVLLAWLDEAAPALTHALETLESLIDPQTIVLGGALPKALVEALVARVHLTERSVANRPERSHPRLMVGACGRMTASHGAAALVINAALTPQMASMA